MFPESGCSDQKLPLPGLSGVLGTLTKQSLKDSECLGGFHFQELVKFDGGRWKLEKIISLKSDFLKINLPSTNIPSFI